MRRRLGRLAWVLLTRDGVEVYHGRDGKVLGEEQIRLLTLVDIFESLSREEIEAIQWKHLNTSVEEGETFYTPMDLCETLFVLHKGRVRIFRATTEGRELRSPWWKADGLRRDGAHGRAPQELLHAGHRGFGSLGDVPRGRGAPRPGQTQGWPSAHTPLEQA